MSDFRAGSYLPGCDPFYDMKPIIKKEEKPCANNGCTGYWQLKEVERA